MSSAADAAPLRDAATIVVLRDGDRGPEALLVRRHGRSGFAADAWVFPGGVVEEGDRELDRARWSGIDPAALSDRFAAPPDLVLGFHVAAVRETFEEAGLLLAATAEGTVPDIASPAVVRARRRLADRDDAMSWSAWLAAEGLVLDLARLTYLSRWVTPAQEPRRYDTAFFLARAPEGQVAAHDRTEVTGQRWTTVAAALDAHRAGDLHLIYPTIRTLEALLPHRSVDGAVGAALAQARVRSVQPHVERDGNSWRILHPDEPGYPHHLYEEAGR